MDNYISASLRLERIFEDFGNKKMSRDQIVSRSTEAIRDGLTWLNGLGILTQEDVSDWRMRYDFDDLSLEKVFENDITKVILYYWNREYPADQYFDLELNDWILESEIEFEGSSHEKITRKIFKIAEDKNGEF